MRNAEGPLSSAEDTPAASTHPLTSSAASDKRLRVSVVNGNLQFVQEPLLVGHYRDAALTGVESIVDQLYRRCVEHVVAARSISAARRQSADIRERGVPLVASVSIAPPIGIDRRRARQRRSVAKQRARDDCPSRRDSLGPASRRDDQWASRAVRAGCHAGRQRRHGNRGGQAARLVVEAVHEANLRLERSDWPCVFHLRLIELFMDRSTEAWRSLKLLDQANPGCFQIDDAVQSGTGGLSRPLDSTYRGADYDLISAITQNDPSGESSIVYTLDTRRARTEVRATATQGRLLGQLVKAASSADNNDRTIGRTLFQLLVPREMRPFLAGCSEMQIEVDSGTAGIPWELLDNTIEDVQRTINATRPWAIRAKLLRKLRIADFRRRIDDASRDAQVLVIGEPYCDDPRYPRLPGARAEAEAVAGILSDGTAASEGLGAGRVRPLVAHTDNDRGPDARTVISALLERDWRVLHISGHGEPPESGQAASTGCDDRLRGVVLSDGIFLGPREIGMLQHTPELVFVNCCHLAARSDDELLAADASPAYDRPRFAASVAEALIRIGVKCVIAAGWAVDDEPARNFATTFYERILAGERFLDAVAIARDAAWVAGGNTWAAYQCYGDANWVLEPATSMIGARRRLPAERYAGIASAVSLIVALEEFETNARYDAGHSTSLIDYLDTTFGSRWGQFGNVAEAYGKAWAAVSVDAKSVAWFERAVAANDGRASLAAADQLANLSARLAWNTLKTQATRSGNVLQAPQQAIDSARTQVNESIHLIESVLVVQRSIERLSLCAAAYKRLALVERTARRLDAEAASQKTMLGFYREAEQLGNAQNDLALLYPLLNRLAAELIEKMTGRDALGFDAVSIARAWAVLNLKAAEDPDFWCIAAKTELRLYESVAASELAINLTSILDEFKDLRTRFSSRNNWNSVLDQCDFVLAAYTASTAVSESETAAVSSLLQTLEGWVCGP